MNNKLRILLCSLLSVIAISAVAIVGCSGDTGDTSDSTSASTSDTGDTGTSDSDTGDSSTHDHVYGTTPDWEWTWDEANNEYIVTASLTCTTCDYILVEDATVTYLVTTPATCVSTGIGTYYAVATLNGTQYTDSKPVDIAIDSNNHNSESVSHVSAVAATETTGGNKEYWYCSDCGKYYSDADLTSAYASVYKTWIAQTGSTLSLTTATTDNTTTIAAEVAYTFTATEANTYAVTVTGDGYSVIYKSAADAESYTSTPYLDIQGDEKNYFTVEMAENETITIYLVGSDVAKVTIEVYDGSGGGTEVTETVIPSPLATGSNVISVTASDAANVAGYSSDSYVTYYGVAGTYTVPENGYYTFSLTSGSDYAYVFVVYGTASNEYYKLSSNSTTTAEIYSSGIYLTSGTTVTVYFSTDDGVGNAVSASYTLNISYVAGTSSLVYPDKLIIGGTVDVVMDNSKQLSATVTTEGDGEYTVTLTDMTNISAVSSICVYLDNFVVDNLTASNNYTLTFEATSGKKIEVWAYITADSSEEASFTISLSYEAKEVETYELTINAYVNYPNGGSLTAYDDSATSVAIAEGKSIYLKAAPGNATYDYNFTLTISSLENLTIYASDDIDSSDTTKAADGSYDMEILASYFTQNEDGTYSYSWTLQRKTYAFFMITASADVTIDVAIAYGGNGGTLGGGSTGGGDEDTNTYIELAKDVTTNITWDGESNAYAVYYSYTSTAAGTGTLTLTSTHAWADSSNGMYSTFVACFTVTVNGETITGSDLAYAFDIIAGTNKIIITFNGGSAMVTGYTYTALLSVKETEADPTEGYTVLTANKTTEITWDGTSGAYTASFCYYATEAVEATLTIDGDQGYFSTGMAESYLPVTLTLNGDAVTGSSKILYTLNLVEGYNYIVLSFTGASTMVDGYTYTLKLAVTDSSHTHSYTIENWTWSNDYTTATLDSLECNGCDETITVNGTATVTSEVTAEASCETKGTTVYTATYTYDGVTYTTTKTVETDYAHKLTYTEGVAATLTVDGHEEYWYCSVCGKYFSDAEGETEVAYADLILKYNTSNTLYNMSEVTLSGGYYYGDDVFSIATTGSTTYLKQQTTSATTDDTVTAYTDDNGNTLDTSYALYNMVATRVISFTLTQPATVTVWYGLVNASYPLYISTNYGTAANVTGNAVATFNLNANASSYANTNYLCVSQGSVTLAAGTYYIATNATSTTYTPYIYAIAINYDLSGVTISGETDVTTGSTTTLTAVASLADGSASSETIVWTTSDETVATVDQNGVVTGVKAGTVTITATAGELSGSITITVTAAAVAIEVGKTYNIELTSGEDDYADSQTATFTTTADGYYTFTITADSASNIQVIAYDEDYTYYVSLGYSYRDNSTTYTDMLYIPANTVLAVYFNQLTAGTTDTFTFTVTYSAENPNAGNTAKLDEKLTLSDSATYTVSIEEAGTYIIVFEGVTANYSNLSFMVGSTSYDYNDVVNSANGTDSYIVFTVGSEDVGDIDITFALYNLSATYYATISKLTANAAGTTISLTEDAQVVAVNLDTATTYQLTIALAADETASLATLINDDTFAFEFSIGYASYNYSDLTLSSDGTYAYFTFTVGEDYTGVYTMEFSLYKYTGTLDYTVTFSVYQESSGEEETTVTGTNAEVNISSLYSAAATISEETSLYSGSDGTTVTVTASSDNTVAVDANKKSIDDYSFTYRMKLGGTGNADYRSIKITTVDACTILVYMISSSSSGTRTVYLYDSEFSSTTLASKSVQGVAISVYEFTVSAAGTYYIGASGGGVNIYNILIDYDCSTLSVAQSVSISGTATTLAAGETATLTATATMADDNYSYTGSYVWVTSDSDAASVSDGVVTAKSVTTDTEVTITVSTNEGVIGTYTITITADTSTESTD